MSSDYRASPRISLRIEVLNLSPTSGANLDYKKLNPFSILERVNLVAFQLALSPPFQLHNVFHVSLLKLHHPSRIPGRQPPLSPPVELSTGEEYEVDRILDSRLHRRRLQYLVLWKGYPLSDATWELVTHLQNASEAIHAFPQRCPHKLDTSVRRQP